MPPRKLTQEDMMRISPGWRASAGSSETPALKARPLPIPEFATPQIRRPHLEPRADPAPAPPRAEEPPPEPLLTLDDISLPEEIAPARLSLETVLCDVYGLPDDPVEAPFDDVVPAREALRVELSDGLRAFGELLPSAARVASTPPMLLQRMRISESMRGDLESRGEFSAFLGESVLVQLRRIWPLFPAPKPDE
jgi:hypothetical protein